jgi:hypothetical protein
MKGAAHLISDATQFDHLNPLFDVLHWLQVPQLKGFLFMVSTQF